MARNVSQEGQKKKAASRYIDARARYDKIALRLGAAKSAMMDAENEVKFRAKRQAEIEAEQADARHAMLLARDECVRLGVPIAEEPKP